MDLRCKVISLGVTAAGIVIADPFCDHIAQFTQCLCIQQQGAILLLEPTEEGFHLGIVPWAGKEGTAQALRYMECLQMDPLNVIARSHDLALWGRVLDYRPNHMETLMYRRTGKDADLPKHWRAACFAWPDL